MLPHTNVRRGGHRGQGGIGGIWNYHELRNCSSFQRYKIQLNTLSPPQNMLFLVFFIYLHRFSLVQSWFHFFPNSLHVFIFGDVSWLHRPVRCRSMNSPQIWPRSSKKQKRRDTTKNSHYGYFGYWDFFCLLERVPKNEFMTFAVTCGFLFLFVTKFFSGMGSTESLLLWSLYLPLIVFIQFQHL